MRASFTGTKFHWDKALLENQLLREMFMQQIAAVVSLQPYFVARLAALVPRPRLKLTGTPSRGRRVGDAWSRFHSLFAPNGNDREHIVPKGKPPLELSHAS